MTNLVAEQQGIMWLYSLSAFWRCLWGPVIESVHKLNTITACFLIGLSVIKLINNAADVLCGAAIVPSVCFMPCMAATGSWGTQLALNDKE